MGDPKAKGALHLLESKTYVVEAKVVDMHLVYSEFAIVIIMPSTCSSSESDETKLDLHRGEPARLASRRLRLALAPV